MREALNYLARMIPAAVLGLLAYWASRPARLKRLEGLGLASGRRHELALALLFMFTAGLLWLTVLPGIFWQGGRLVFLREGLGEINLKPFLIFKQADILAKRGVKSYFLINFWGNILMFVPIGFLPALLWRGQRWWKALLSGAGLSFFIEICQIFVSRGTDIDDLWLNTLGALLGYWLYCLLRRLWPGVARTFYVREARAWT